MKPVLEVDQLHVSLNSRKGNHELVKGVAFSVMPGECLGILGESGSGKSMAIPGAIICVGLLVRTSFASLSIAPHSGVGA